MRITNVNFFKQPANILAPTLLGKYLCRNIEGEQYRYMITETECYMGLSDSASHAYKGKTNRTKIMWEEGGVCYVYLCYGIHFLFNIICGNKNEPQGVLIRSVKGFTGPGRMTKQLKIDKSIYGESLLTSNRIWLEDNTNQENYITTKRIGIDYANQEDINKPWRFLLNENIKPKL